MDFQQCWKVMFIDMFDEYYTKSIQIIYLYQVGWTCSTAFQPFGPQKGKVKLVPARFVAKLWIVVLP